MRKIFTFFLALGASVGTMMAAIPQGAISGKFTINAEGDQVRFSQGNLQYVASTETWQFATNQWDYIGNAVGNITDDPDRATQSDPIDMFGWGTGNNPTTVSSDNADYTTFTDWSTHPISNGGNTANIWRTLSRDEWVYIFHERENAETLFGFGRVNYKQGVIILPDDWDPTGVTFYPSTGKGLAWNSNGYYNNTNKNNYDHNNYSADMSQWNTMQSKGAVFLPVTGMRSRSGDVLDVSLLDEGNYWATTPYEEDDTQAYQLWFSKQYCAPQSNGWRRAGRAVRLVIDVPKVGDEFYATPYLNSDDITLHFRITSLSPNSEVEVMVDGHTIPENANLFLTNVKYLGYTFSIKSVASSAKFQNADTIVLSPDVVTFPVETMNLPNLKEFGLLTGSDIFAVVDKVLYTKDKTKLLRCPAKHAFTTFPNTVTEMEAFAFRGCSELGEIVLPNGMTKIPQGAFFQSSVTKITVPASVEDLDDSCFGSCASLADVDFEDASTIKRTSWNSFSNCKVVSDQSEDGWVIVDGLVTNFRGAWPETVVVPEGVVNMATAVFYPYASGFENVKKIVLPTTLKRLDESAFAESETYKMANLETVIVRAPSFVHVANDSEVLRLWTDKYLTLIVPCGLESEYAAATVWKSAFDVVKEGVIWDVQLTQTLGGTILAEENSVCGEVKMTAVPETGYALYEWNTGVTAPVFVFTATKDTAFSATFKKILTVGDTFTAETVEGVTVTYKILSKEEGNMTVQVGEKDGFVGNVGQAISKSYTGALTIPAKVQYFDEEYDVVALGASAFYGCKISSLSLPSSVQALAQNSIYECTELKSVNIPEGITIIPRYNFSYMNLLESLTLPTSLEYICSGVLNNNTKMATIENWNPSQYIRVGGNIGSMNTKYFTNNCVIENGLKYSGDILLDRVNILEADTLVVKDGTRLIPTMAYNPNVKTVVFPASLEAIGAEALNNYPVLESCTLKVATPPVVYVARDTQDPTVERTADEILAGSTPTDIKVYVPKTAVATYKANTKWNMLDIRPIGGWEITFIDGDGNVISTQHVEEGEMPEAPENATKIATATTKYVFSGWDKTVVAATEDATYTAQFTALELINAISLTVTFPDKGDAIEACSGYTDPSEVVTVTCPEGAHYSCNRVVFYKEGECFSEPALLPNTTYQMALEFVADDGYYFPSAIGGDGVERVQNDQISFTINDQAETCGERTVGVARCYVEFTTSKQEYMVRFLDWDDTVLDTQSVVEGEDAVAPENPTRAGWIFTGWDKSFTNIQEDTDVKALYEQDTTGLEQIEQSQMGNDKFIKDGQLFIRRNGELFNAQGTKVK